MKATGPDWLIRTALVACSLAIFAFPLGAADPPVRYARYADISGVLDEVRPQLPLDLQALPSLAPDAPWNAWLSQHDDAIRARLAQGDEDTIVDWVLYGASFTTEPPTPTSSTANNDPAAMRAVSDLLHARIADFVRALGAPGTDERRLFARRFFEGNGFTLATSDGVDELSDHLMGAIGRIASEEQDIDDELQAAARSNDPRQQAGVRAHINSQRGLSIEASLAPNYAVEQALAAMKARGLAKPGTIARVAIIGPGLDFAGGGEGFDSYPVQTLQPFAIIDSLRKLGLAPTGSTPDVVCFDISPRVRDHVARARMRAEGGEAYTLNLPLSKRTMWLPSYRAYWQAFGGNLGTAAEAPSNPRAELRTIRVPAATVEHVSAVDLNIVTQRMDDTRFDLIVATNVFAYYDTLDQALAVANIEAMLKNGSFLLSNTVLPEILWVPTELVDSTAVLYNGSNDGDQILWYQRMAGTVTKGTGNK